MTEDKFESKFKGLTIPVRKKPGGYFATETTSEIIKSSIKMILITKIGERVMTPSFGSRLHQLMFEPNDQVLQSLARRFVADAVQRWEPRIKMINASVASNEHEMSISIFYEISIVGTEDYVTLVFRREGV